ncbi:alpha/beta hydrolase fold domain-containing protein [Engelhardtia mirabilis]|uniref:Carboxylesterase NlhH n=1 Tax=Engelhardtia mirabilis TaxID=2528011 RepID=A0A518BDX5_9BACT|nr:Carboxylesterase NlhH [Planctomycetes bacterium Pla133]QDU99506.1 Carboxylesterase NlhH [Planctomycetes bacterium Pla86]
MHSSPRGLVAALALVCCTSSPTTARTQLGPTHSDLVYATVPGVGGAQLDLKLDLYLPPSPSGPLPTVIWIHGGGWAGGSKFPSTAAPLVLAGYAVASIDYRVSGIAPWPAQMHDCKAAVRWLRANAATYGLDPDRFGASGSSAGGHLAAFLGTSGGVDTLGVGGVSVDVEGTVGDHLGESSRVQAVADYYGPTDFLRMSMLPSMIDHDLFDSPESKLIGAPIQAAPELTLTADPTQLLSRDDPPFKLIHGTADNSVPFDQSEHLWRTAREVHGLDWELVAIPDGGHGGPGFGIGHAAAWFDVHLAPRDTTVGIELLSSPGEGAGPGALRIERAGPTTADLAVLLFAAGSAEPARDYLPLPQRVVIPAGSASRSVPVFPIQDGLVEGDESLTVTIAPSADYLIDHAATAIELVIADDDGGPLLPTVTVSTVDGVATEGSVDGALARITRSGGLAAPLTVRYRVRGSAVPGVDHDRVSGEALLAPGQASIDLPLAALDDDLAEPTEVWVVELLAGNAYALDPVHVASGRIDDDDRVAGQPLLGLISESSLGVEAGQDLVFVLTRTGSASSPLNVGLLTSGSASPLLDLSGVPASASFAQGQSFTRVTLGAVADGLPEGAEFLDLTLAATPGHTSTETRTRRATIADADAPSIAGEPLELVVGATRLGTELLVDLGGPASSPCAVYLAASAGFLPVLGQPILLDVASAQLLFSGATGADGSARFRAPIADDPALVNLVVSLQGLAVDGAGSLRVSAATERRLCSVD